MLIKTHLFDKRVVARALQKGLLDAAQYAKVIAALPDLSDQVQRPVPQEDTSAAQSAQAVQ